MLAQVGPKLAQVCPSWSKLAPSEPPVGSNLAPCWPMLGQVGPKLAPSWLQVGPKVVHVGPGRSKLAQDHPKLAPRWPQVGPCWLMLTPSWPHDSPSSKVSPRLAKASTKALPPQGSLGGPVKICLSRAGSPCAASSMNHDDSFWSFHSGSFGHLFHPIVSTKKNYPTIHQVVPLRCFVLEASSLSCIARRHSSTYMIKYMQEQQKQQQQQQLQQQV